MVLFNPQVSSAAARGFALQPASGSGAGTGAQNNGNPNGANPAGLNPAGLDPAQFQQNLQRADELASACANCGSCAGCGGGGGGSGDAIRQAAQQGQDPNAAFEAFKQQQYDEIFQHESAHQSAAGAFGGGINIEYGANGIPVGGHVDVQMPSLDSENPEGSVQHAETVKRAALAPSDPSGQDMSVASQAQAILGQAQVLVQQKQQREQQGLPPTAAAGVPAQ